MGWEVLLAVKTENLLLQSQQGAIGNSPLPQGAGDMQQVDLAPSRKVETLPLHRESCLQHLERGNPLDESKSLRQPV